MRKEDFSFKVIIGPLLGKRGLVGDASGSARKITMIEAKKRESWLLGFR